MRSERERERKGRRGRGREKCNGRKMPHYCWDLIHCCEPFLLTRKLSAGGDVQEPCGSAVSECGYCFVPKGMGDDTTEIQPSCCFYFWCCWCGPCRSINQFCVWSALGITYGISRITPKSEEFCCGCGIFWDSNSGVCPLPRGGW